MTKDLSDEATGFDIVLQDREEEDRLYLDIDGFEGPLDLLLMLARTQKVDLADISILALVEQYLRYINQARKIRIEIAADYLVMAAWLAYLKSRLLLPREDATEEPSGEELALRLQLRLQRLDAMRDAGARLMARNRLGRDVFARGAPEGLKVMKKGQYDISFYDLLRAYADIRQKNRAGPLKIEKRPVFSLEDALDRLSGLIGRSLDWSDLQAYLPKGLQDKRLARSAVASHFAASLELVRQGVADIRQNGPFQPLMVRRKV